MTLGPLLLGVASPVRSQSGDTLTLNAALTKQTDSNLFRLSDAANVSALIGAPTAAETISVTTVGFNINKAFSLQRLELSVNLVDTKFQNFDYLDYVSRNYDAAWRWSVTPRLRGNISSQRNETLNSFADFQNFRQRNERTNTTTRFDAAYDVNGPWQLLAGIAKVRQTNEQAVLDEGDFTTNTADLGLRLSYASGTSLTYTLKKTDGTYLNRVLSQASLSDDGFNQTDQILRLRWAISDKSVADITAARINRTHPNFAERNYQGTTASTNLSWNIAAKSALTAGWSRELSSFQTNSVNYAQKDRFTVGPTWQISPKAAVRLRHEIAKTSYRGTLPGAQADVRADTTHDSSLTFDWQPHQRLSLQASVQKTSRDSNFAGLDYGSKLATLSAQFNF